MRFYSIIYIIIFWGLLFVGSLFSFEGEKDFKPINKIDYIQLRNLQKKNIEPANICSDAVFIRRVYLDLCGRIPAYIEVKNFLADKAVDKREKLIESLLQRDEFAHYWALRWGDILRIKSEFPINMWPNAVQSFCFWIYDSIRRNKAYDIFVREMLTASGSNFRDPPVNFYRSTPDKSPEGLAKIAVLAFLCSRLDTWNEFEKNEICKIFSKVSYKKTDEWKEEIVFVNPEPFENFTVNMPDGTVLKINDGEDPREIFAKWLNGAGKKFFAEAAVNRVWFWLFGRGIVHEPDDFRFERESSVFSDLLPSSISPVRWNNRANKPVNPELLEYLADEFIKSNYDFKKLVATIVNSATYQQSSIAKSDLAIAEKYFAVYKIRRLDAEVIADMISYFSFKKTGYISVIPEPFTYIPAENLSISLNDGSITSSFLELFGRSPRDTGLLLERNNTATYAQKLFFLNSSDIQEQLCLSPRLREVMKGVTFTPKALVETIYFLYLSRPPTKKETEQIIVLFKKDLEDLSREAENTRKKKNDKLKADLPKKIIPLVKNITWFLVNSQEFIYKH